MKNKCNLVNAKDMLSKAREFNYAVAQININNLEWTRWVLEAAEETKTPVILGVSEGAAKYMGGLDTVFSMANAMVGDLNISVPVAIHLDHGTYEGCKKALEAGFTSVMFDGSSLPFEENLALSGDMVKLCKKYGASLEVELGGIGGTEDGVTSNGSFANVKEVVTMAGLDVDAIAVNYGSIHGIYPKNWGGLDYDLLATINQKVDKALVLHGGSGIPEGDIRKSISLGINKINVNTELQLVFASKIREYVNSGKDLDMKGKGYDPRKFFKFAAPAVKDVCVGKFKLFGSFGVAQNK